MNNPAKRQTKRQLHSLIQSYIQSKKGMVMDARKASEMMQSEYGLYYDWHEFSDVLVFLNGIDEAQEIGLTKSRMTEYLIGYFERDSKPLASGPGWTVANV